MNVQRYSIIVGVDGSEGGRRALAWAVRHAVVIGADVEAVTAWSWDGTAFVPGDVGGPDEARTYAAAQNQADIETVLGDLDGPAPAVTSHVVEGNAIKVLTGTAEASDLLVLGSHGRAYLATALLGSVSEACVRRGTTPVVIVPAFDRTVEMVGTNIFVDATS